MSSVWAHLPPGRYIVDYEPPAGYAFVAGRPPRGEVDVLAGRIELEEVFLVSEA